MLNECNRINVELLKKQFQVKEHFLQNFVENETSKKDRAKEQTHTINI